MDHHCGVIGNCIGKANYKIFLMFVISFNGLAWLTIIQGIVYIVNKVQKY
jgi:hypothetical protein